MGDIGSEVVSGDRTLRVQPPLRGMNEEILADNERQRESMMMSVRLTMGSYWLGGRQWAHVGRVADNGRRSSFICRLDQISEQTTGNARTVDRQCAHISKDD